MRHETPCWELLRLLPVRPNRSRFDLLRKGHGFIEPSAGEGTRHANAN